MCGFAGGGLEDIFEGREGFRKVFGKWRGDDLEICETNLGEELFSAWGGRGEDHSFVPKGGYDGDFEGEGSS